MKKVACSIIMLFAFLIVSAQHGTIKGKISDAKTGEIMPGVSILVQGTTIGTTTDLEGRFKLELKPGNYNLEISFISYKKQIIENLSLRENQTIELDKIVMTEESIVLSEITIMAKEVRNTENSIIAMKRKSPNTIDGISESTIRKTGDANAIQSMKRISGISVNDGKYVFVRGLGDRYSKTILNGLDIPGLDPDRNSIQMDLFPTNIINNILVIKTFTADLPADFTGGIINIETKDFPEEKINNISFSFGYKPKEHFNSEFLTYKGGNFDFLGFDDGTRKIPVTSNIPQFAEVVGNPEGEKALRYKEILRSFNPELAAKRSKSLMDYSFSYNFSNQKTHKHFRLGYNFNFSYKHNYQFFKNAEYGRYGLMTDKNNYDLDRREYQIGDIGKEDVFINILSGFVIKTNNSKYRINFLHLQNGEKETAIYDFHKTSLGTNFSGISHILTYSQRSLSNIIVNGEHSFENKNLIIDWKVSPTISIIYDPDIRFTRYEDREGNYQISTESGFPERIWRNIMEYDIAAASSLTKDVKIFSTNFKIKVGISNTYKQQSFLIRNFAINVRNLSLTGDPDELFKPENLWPYNNNILSGTTYEVPFLPVNPNQFNSNSNTLGSYFSAEFSPLTNIKLIMGIRGEKYTLQYTGRDQVGYHILDNETVMDDIKFFPTINIIFSITEQQNIRLAAFKTIARPSFKELSFAEIFDPISGKTFIGSMFRDANDIEGIEYWDGNLKCTDIYNIDLRWELYSKKNNYISISSFGKIFENPIEIVQFASQIGAYQPRNVGTGQLIGAETELKTDFGFLSENLNSIGIFINYTYTYSRIELSKTELNSKIENARTGEIISKYRDMAGQAPYLINCGITYQTKSELSPKAEFGLFYNVQGTTLLYPGIADIPDIYAKPFHSLNFNANINIDKEEKFLVSFNIENILNQYEEIIYNSLVSQENYYSKLRKSRSFKLKVTYNIK